MWSYVVRRLLYNVPVYLGIVMFLMAALRIQDPISASLGKNATSEDYLAKEAAYGLDDPFFTQYFTFLGDLFAADFSAESWANPGKTVGAMLYESIWPSLSITFPALTLTALIAITIGLISSFFRGQKTDKSLMLLAVVGMSVSFLVYIIFGQYFGAYVLNEYLKESGALDGTAIFARGELFSIGDYDTSVSLWWIHFCMLPVLISTLVATGYDTRFYRAVMVEESGRDYIVTAQAKGASKKKIMFVHMLKNAMIPIITRLMTTLPFLIMGSLLLEVFFRIPGMGRVLLDAIMANDFPVVQAFVGIFALIFILSNILTDVLYALVDPRVRLS